MSVFNNHTPAPLEELEVYKDIVINLVSQLNILKQYDNNFIFLETNMVMHLRQIEDMLKVKEMKMLEGKVS